MTQTPPQNLPPQVYFSVPCYLPHSSPFIFLTCRALLTPISPYSTDDTALLSQSWRPDTLSRRLSNALTTLLKYFLVWKLRLKTNKNLKYCIFKVLSPAPRAIQIQTSAIYAVCHVQIFCSPGNCTPLSINPHVYFVTFPPTCPTVSAH
jgi:hypothetical protein